MQIIKEYFSNLLLDHNKHLQTIKASVKKLKKYRLHTELLSSEWTGNNVEERSHGLEWLRKISQDVQCSDWDPNWVPPAYRSQVLLLEPTCLVPKQERHNNSNSGDVTLWAPCTCDITLLGALNYSQTAFHLCSISHIQYVLQYIQMSLPFVWILFNLSHNSF